MKTINDIYEGILSDIDIAMGEDDINMKKVTILDKLNSYLAKQFSPQQAEKFIEFDFDEDIPVLNINCSVYYNHSQKLDGLTDGSFRFGTIKGHFVISDTDFVTSLKYGPKAIVGKRSDGEPHDFDINGKCVEQEDENCWYSNGECIECIYEYILNTEKWISFEEATSNEIIDFIKPTHKKIIHI